MKKLMCVAIAALALTTISCDKKMSPEAAEAWNNFKVAAQNLSNIDESQDFEALSKIVDEWVSATDEIANHFTEYSPEIIDSMNAISDEVVANVQTVIEMQQVAQEKAIREQAEEQAEGPEEQESVD